MVEPSDFEDRIFFVVSKDTSVKWPLVCDNLRLGWAHAIKCAEKAGVSPKFRREVVEYVATGKCLDVLINCARHWDSAFGVKFSTYAYVALGRAVKPRDCVIFPPRVVLNQEIRARPDGKPIEAAESRNTLHDILARLEERDRLVLLMRYWRGMSCRQIGKEFGHSKTMGQNMVTRALKAAQRAARDVVARQAGKDDSK